MMQFSSGGDETGCGRGSMFHRSIDAIKTVERIVKQRDIESILDIGCGDVNWIRWANLRGASYHGVDIDERHVARAKERMPHATFTHGDDFGSGYGLVLCRHVMQHLPNNKAEALLDKALNSGEYRLITHHPGTKVNAETKMHGFRPIALNEPPFSLVPIETYRDDELELWLI